MFGSGLLLPLFKTKTLKIAWVVRGCRRCIGVPDILHDAAQVPLRELSLKGTVSGFGEGEARRRTTCLGRVPRRLPWRVAAACVSTPPPAPCRFVRRRVGREDPGGPGSSSVRQESSSERAHNAPGHFTEALPRKRRGESSPAAPDCLWRQSFRNYAEAPNVKEKKEKPETLRTLNKRYF